MSGEGGDNLKGDEAGDSLPEEIPHTCLLVAPHRQALRCIIGGLAVALPETLPAPAIFMHSFDCDTETHTRTQRRCSTNC